MNRCHVCDASVTVVFAAPSLSWTSSIATMSGLRMFSTRIRASRSNLPSSASTNVRFSTFIEPTDSSSRFGAFVTSRFKPLSIRAGAAVRRYL